MDRQKKWDSYFIRIVANENKAYNPYEKENIYEASVYLVSCVSSIAFDAMLQLSGNIVNEMLNGLLGNWTPLHGQLVM